MNRTLGLAVVTFNEASRIEACLASVPFAIDKVVVDSQSTDDTRTLAARSGARVIEKKWAGYSDQKQFALDQLNTDWILCLDADEFLTVEAQNEIRKLLSQAEIPHHGFRIPRFHVFMRRVIYHGKGVDYPLRLVKKGSARYSGRAIHEELLLDGEPGTLRRGMVHESSPTFVSRLKKMKRDVNAEEQYFVGNPRAITFGSLFLVPIKHFFSYLVKHEGWRDGPKGWLVILLSAIQLFWLELSYLKFKFFGARRSY